MSANNTNTTENLKNGSEIGKLVQCLQREDSRNMRIFRNFQGVFLAFIILYGLFFIVNPFADLTLLDRVSGVCYVLAFTVFGWVFRKHYHQYKRIDYSLPVSEMLEKAAERYALKNRKSVILIIPLLLIDAAITITLYRHFPLLQPWERIGVVQAVYISILIVSFMIGVLIWYKKQKPLRDEALKLLEELRS